MALRAQIVNRALWWAAPGEYKPYPSHLIYFCSNAGCEQIPSEAEAQKSLTYNNGVLIGGKIKHWCGIFACSVLKECGVNVHWTLMGGKMLGAATIQWGYYGMQPGDVAIVQKTNAANITDQHHHFIIVSVSGNVAQTVEGNTYPGNKIRSSSRKLNTGNKTTSIYGYYRLI